MGSSSFFLASPYLSTDAKTTEMIYTKPFTLERVLLLMFPNISKTHLPRLPAGKSKVRKNCFFLTPSSPKLLSSNLIYPVSWQNSCADRHARRVASVYP